LVLGGAAWAASGLLLVAFGHPVMGPHPAYFWSSVVALPPTLAGLMGLHALQEGRCGRVGRAGLYAILLAFALQDAEVAALLSGNPTLGWIASPAGLLVEFVGFALYGSATLRAGVLPRPCGLALMVLVPVSVALLAYGNLWRGLVLLVVGYALWRRKDVPAGRRLEPG
jgi:hypothetical protein